MKTPKTTKAKPLKPRVEAGLSSRASAGYAAGDKRGHKLSPEEALQLAEDWNLCHDEATMNEECNCEAAADKLRMEALDIEEKLSAAGYENPQRLLDNEARRKRHIEKLTDR